MLYHTPDQPDLTRCPKCGGKMAGTHSRMIGSTIERRRKCKGCDYQDKAMVQPEVVLSARPLSCVVQHTYPSDHESRKATIQS